MPILKLSKRTLAGLPNVDRSTIFFDSDLKGFGLRVSPGGVRSWILEYRPGSGGRRVAKRRLLLGSAEVLSPDQARTVAKDHLATVRLGGDPAATKSASRGAATVTELARRYDDESGVGRKPRTKVLYSSYWRIHILPEIGKLHAKDVSRADVVRMHRAIGAKFPITANRSLSLLSTFFTWAQAEKEVPAGHNPALAIDRYRESGSERYLIKTEMLKLGKAIHEAETIGIEWVVDQSAPNAKHVPKNPDLRRTRIGPHAAAAIRLLCLTGCRLREILHLRWKEVDFERGLLLLPDSKTGRKTVVLSAAAQLVLSGLPRFGEFVILGEDPTKPRSDLKRPWALISRRAGLDGVRLHDLRHSFASIGAGAGMGLPIIGQLLGHADPRTTKRYAHLDADPLRRASDAIAGTIDAAMRGSSVEVL